MRDHTHACMTAGRIGMPYLPPDTGVAYQSGPVYLLDSEIARIADAVVAALRAAADANREGQS